MLGPAVLIALDEGVRRLDNGRPGTVILLHVQHLGVGIDGVELREGLGPGGPEAVDALILVPHHEEVAALPR